MSLFKARDWWHAVAGEGEQFDQGCMCIGNVDNSQGGKNKDKIIVGSYHGIIRIYNPNPMKMEQGWSGFRPEELILEHDLNAPILQLSIGFFVSGSPKLHLAVLHPRKLSVFAVAGVAGAVQHGSQYQLSAIYEHKLQRSAFNMCHGPFGQVQGKDYICVQSVDGSLSIFEQERFSFTRFLPESLLPGPLHYIPQTDSFVTVSSSRHLESYRYQVLAIASDTKSKEESQNVKSGKRVTADWTYQLGETAISMQIVNLPGVPLSILVLGKHSIYSVSEYGKLRFAKKLDYSGAYIHAYASVSPPVTNYVVSSHNVLLIYADTILKWTAHTEKTPVQVQVANLDALRGIIVCLSEDGHIHCCYLGTDPAMMVMPSSQLREINYDQQDVEMKRLQALIKEKSSTGGGAAALRSLRAKNDGSEDDVRLTVASELDPVSRAADVTFQDDDPVPSMTVKVNVKARRLISNVRLSLHVTQPLVATSTQDEDVQLGAGQELTMTFTVYMKYDYLPAATWGEVSVAYQNSTGAPRVQRSPLSLPAKLVLKCVPPQKIAAYKVTIDTNKPPVSLADIFGDIACVNTAGSSATAIGFQFYGGSPSSVVTLLASKTSQRYRLQSDDFGAMWLITSELSERLQKHYRQSADGCQCSFSGPLPLQEYLQTIDTHFDCRVQAERYKELLEQRAAQFRVIQKRLLTRFKDKTPTPLANLDTLLEGTFRQMLALADGAEDNWKSLTRASNALSCATRLFNYLIRISTNMNDEDHGVLQAALSPFVNNGDQGWEETADAALTHLLRTSLSKSSGPKDQAINPAPLVMPEDTSKLKKHVALLCDRLLSKGGRLAADAPHVAPESAAAPVASARPTDSGGDSYDSEDRPPMMSRFREKRSSRGKEPSTSTGSRAGGSSSSSQGAAPSLPPLTGSSKLPPLTSSLSISSTSSGSKMAPLHTGERPIPKKVTVPDLDALTISGGGGGGDDGDAIDV